MTSSEEREYLFLKGCLSDPELSAVGESTVNDTSLSVAGNIIYRAILQMRRSGTEVISPESLAYHLNNSDSLQLIGGLTTLNAINDIGFVCDVDGFKEIADDIRLGARKRNIKNILLELAESMMEDPDELIADVIKKVYEVCEDTLVSHVMRADEAARYVHERKAFVTSSIHGLDKIIGGLVKNEYIIVAARASTGKTALGVQMGLVSALEDHPTIIFSLEQSRNAIMGRILRMISIEDLAGVPLHLMCQSGLTIGKIMATVQMMKIMHGIEVVVIDYVGLIGGRRSGQTKNDFLDMVSKGIQRMARNMDVTVIALVQLNRNSEKEDREPALYDLRDSGDLEQDADNVILIHRRTRDESNAKIIVAKQREGRIGAFNCRFDAATVSFVDI